MVRPNMPADGDAVEARRYWRSNTATLRTLLPSRFFPVVVAVNCFPSSERIDHTVWTCLPSRFRVISVEPLTRRSSTEL